MTPLRRTLGIGLLAALWVSPLLAADTPAQLGDAGVIYPRNSPEARQQAASDEPFPIWSSLAAIVVLTAGGFYYLKRGTLGVRAGVKVTQRLAIEETRPLGNKQFLAVATYGDRRLLLAVCAGRIDLLCRLDESADVPAPKAPVVETRM